MNPGASASPARSTTSAFAEGASEPAGATAAMRSPASATSAGRAGAPVPSTSVAPRRRVSTPGTLANDHSLSSSGTVAATNGGDVDQGLLDRRALFIGGEWVEPAAAERFGVVSPATEEVVGHVPLAETADVDRAVAAARLAFDEGPWPRTTPAERAEI